MDKIVLLTDRPQEYESLKSCLKILFPECEIQVQPKNPMVLQGASLALEASTDEK